MIKKLAFVFIAIMGLQPIVAQQMVLKKGTILKDLAVHDSIPDTFSMYLPTNFTTDKQWPLLLVFDMEGKEKQTLSMFMNAAEAEGYVLAAPRLLDSISLSNNMISTSNAINRVLELLPIQKSRIYAAGKDSGARFSNLVPLFIKQVKGAMAIGSSITNVELLSPKRPFHFIGIVNKNNFNYTSMKVMKRVLDRFRFPNQLMIYPQYEDWPNKNYMQKALQYFTLSAMRTKNIPTDSSFVENVYQSDLKKVNDLKSIRKLLLAEHHLTEMMSIYGAYKNLDSLRTVQKELRKDRIYKGMKRAENSAALKESLLKEDYQYYIEEDVVTHNFNNLGWWNYQMTELEKFVKGTNPYEKEMGNRLKGYVNALAEDNIDIVNSEALIDEDALAFLYMLKTILEPDNFDFYLKIISLSAKNEDFGTALFYLEEALKKGFKDIDRLYNLEDTALFRINPKFNEVVSKYLKDARYEIKEQ